eukprot:jgi/Mesvir1/19110/Mv12855-RA.1
MKCVLHPVTASEDIEYSVHSCPKPYTEELRAIFPGVDVSQLLIIPTNQRARLDLAGVGADIEDEKNRLLDEFLKFSRTLEATLAAEGHWADYMDPCSGLPMVHRETQVVYSEVDSMEYLLGYKTANAGCCKVLLHPRWGSGVYPSTFFTTAPLDVVVSTLNGQLQREFN